MRMYKVYVQNILCYSQIKKKKALPKIVPIPSILSDDDREMIMLKWNSGDIVKFVLKEKNNTELLTKDFSKNFLCLDSRRSN